MENVKEIVIHHVNPVVAVVVYLFCVSMPLGAGYAIQSRPAHEVPLWYRRIKKPWFTPPDWVFISGSLIFNIMMGTASYLLWYEHVTRTKNITIPIIAYLLTLVFTKIFKPLFLERGWFISALIDNVLLWLSVAGCVYLFHPISPLAAHMMVPYLGWVTLSLMLTLYIVVNNPEGPKPHSSLSAYQ